MCGMHGTNDFTEKCSNRHSRTSLTPPRPPASRPRRAPATTPGPDPNGCWGSAPSTSSSAPPTRSARHACQRDHGAWRQARARGPGAGRRLTCAALPGVRATTPLAGVRGALRAECGVPGTGGESPGFTPGELPESALAGEPRELAPCTGELMLAGDDMLLRPSRPLLSAPCLA